MKQSLQWSLGYHRQQDSAPETWIPARVPGAVQQDVAKAENYAPYYFNDHYKAFLWMEDQFWTYRSHFKKPDLGSNDRIYFISKGIDYEFDIYLNDEFLFHQEGMFAPVRLDITAQMKSENELRVVVYPIPKVSDERNRFQARLSVKPPVSYGWDWHPRLVPIGIWDDTYLEVAPESHWLDMDFDYVLSEDYKQANISVELKGKHLKGCSFAWKITDPFNEIVFDTKENITQDQFTIFLNLDNIKLWWPNGQGDANLYQSKVILKDPEGNVVDELIRKVGFRRVRLVMNEGAWKEPQGFPKSRSVPPITLEINGRRIFAKGSNWVHPEIFPGTLTETRYRELLELVVNANFNIVRVWGGGIVNKESFFEICDELGIMVWQDFPLACLDYPDDAHYLEVLEQEARSIIKRVRQHPCLAIWCGGNELFNAWSRMTDQSHALRLLNSLCYQLDPKTPFIMTTPLMGMGHGHYIFRDEKNGGEVMQWMPKARNTAYTEYGMSSPSSVETLKKIVPEEDLFPAKPGTSWEIHHAYNAWQGNTWLCEHILEHYFGPARNLETLVRNGQLLQGVGYRFIFEEARRQWPYCSMALNWCFNDVWPSAAQNSLVEYPAIPKPAYKQVQLACRPILASARYKQFMWKVGDTLSADIYILNDSPDVVQQGLLKVFFQFGQKKYSVFQWKFEEVPALCNLEGPTIKFKLPDVDVDQFQLLLEVEDRPELNSEYTLLLRQLIDEVTMNTGRLNE